MAIRLLHPAVSPHIFRGAHAVWFEGVRYRVLTAQGAPLLTDVVALPTPIAPVLEGGSLALEGTGLVLTAPTVTAGRPAPALSLVSLTRDGDDVRGEIEGGRIPDAAPGDYVAVWSASNGVTPTASRTAMITVDPVVVPPPVTAATPTRTGFVVTSLGPVPAYDFTPTKDGFVARRQDNG